MRLKTPEGDCNNPVGLKGEHIGESEFDRAWKLI